MGAKAGPANMCSLYGENGLVVGKVSWLVLEKATCEAEMEERGDGEGRGVCHPGRWGLKRAVE